MVAIFVVLMFLGFILADLTLQKLEARRAALALVPARGGVSPARGAARPAIRRDWPALPEAIYLSESHSWLRPRPLGVFQIGLDALVGQAVGSVTRIVPPRVGSEVWAGAPLFQIAAGERVLTVAAPVSGRVVEVNGELHELARTGRAGALRRRVGLRVPALAFGGREARVALGRESRGLVRAGGSTLQRVSLDAIRFRPCLG